MFCELGGIRFDTTLGQDFAYKSPGAFETYHDPENRCSAIARRDQSKVFRKHEHLNVLTL